MKLSVFVNLLMENSKIMEATEVYTFKMFFNFLIFLKPNRFAKITLHFFKKNFWFNIDKLA